MKKVYLCIVMIIGSGVLVAMKRARDSGGAASATTTTTVNPLEVFRQAEQEQQRAQQMFQGAQELLIRALPEHIQHMIMRHKKLDEYIVEYLITSSKLRFNDVRDMQFDVTGTKILFHMQDGSWNWYDLVRNNQIAYPATWQHARLSKDGTKIAYKTDERVGGVRDIASGQSKEFQGIDYIRMDQSGRLFCVLFRDDRLSIERFTSGSIAIFKNIASATISENGHKVLIKGRNNKLYSVDTREDHPFLHPIPTVHNIHVKKTISLCSDGSAAAIVYEDGFAQVRDMQIPFEQKCRWRSGIQSLQLNRDGSRAVVVYEPQDGVPHQKNGMLFDVNTQQVLKSWNAIRQIAISDDGNKVVVIADDLFDADIPFVYDHNSGEFIITQDVQSIDPTREFVMSNNGEAVLLLFQDNNLIWRKIFVSEQYFFAHNPTYFAMSGNGETVGFVQDRDAYLFPIQQIKNFLNNLTYDQFQLLQGFAQVIRQSSSDVHLQGPFVRLDMGGHTAADLQRRTLYNAFPLYIRNALNPYVQLTPSVQQQMSIQRLTQ